MRLACLHVPSFSLAAWLRADAELIGEVLVVVEGKGPRATVIAASSAAQRHGLAEGLSVAQATARYAEVVVRPRSADAERAAQAALGDVADAFSPRVEDGGEGTVYLGIDGSAALHGPEHDLAHALVRHARQLGLEVQVGVASTKIAALLAARDGGGVTVLSREREWQFIEPLPIRVLEPSPALQETLTRWGIRCLGQLAALPAAAVATRLGPEAALLAQRARGEDVHPLVARAAPIQFEESMELDYAVETMEPGLFVMRALLDRLTARLGLRGFICGDLRVSLALANRSRDERTVVVAAPSNDVKSLLTLIRLQLETHPPAAPIERFRLAAIPERLRATQLDLFRPKGPAPEQLAVTIARLAALCGADRIGEPVVADSHRPDAYGIAPFGRDEKGVMGLRGYGVRDGKGSVPVTANPVTPNPLLLSLRAIRPPRPIAVFRNRGELDYVRPADVADGKRYDILCTGRVVTIAGPWRVHGDWWTRDSYTRDYYDLQLTDGGIYRIYHDLQRDTWFVDGAYD